MMNRLSLIGISIALMFSSIQGQEDLQLNSVFSTVENCNFKTEGIFVVWWDKNFDYADEADALLQTLVDVQEDCLNIYHMLNPPNPIAGYYYNVYIHNGNDLFPDGWAMGQGTDTNGFPFLTIPIGYARLYSAGAQHEGFHIFQYNANSPGYAYSGDSQWYIEATANWYAALKHPNSKEEFVTASAVTYNPQVPMWYTYNNRESGDQGNWQRYCHQYGMNIFINYLTDVKGVSTDLIVGGFFAETEQLPQEYLYKGIGPEAFCEIYADFAAHNVGGFEHFPVGVEARAYQELTTYGDLNDVHPIVQTFTNEGSNGEWIRPKNDFVTRAWAYNVYKIENSEAASYTFELRGDATGDEGAMAAFRGRIVVKNQAAIKYYELEMSGSTDGAYTFIASPDDQEINLIIISTPQCFKGNQKFFYEVKIERNPATGINSLSGQNVLDENFPNPSDSNTTIPYELATDAEVEFTITDSSGRIVVVRNEGLRSAGKHIIRLSTNKLKPGTYYYTMRAGSFVESRSMIIK